MQGNVSAFGSVPNSGSDGAACWALSTRLTWKGRAVDETHSPIQPVLVLRRVDGETNAHRFYVLMIERDLFGHIVLVRRWGRIGTRGRERMDPHPDEVTTAEALAKLAAAKRRRGYQDL
jgi:predicted DNA-binding WGR domain protein